MNFKMVLKSLGIVLICEAIFMLPSLLVAFYYKGNDVTAFLYTIAIIIVVGLPMSFIKPAVKNIYAKEGFAIVGFGWILISLFGALPFYISGMIPSMIDAIFEAISGFTTTGASILKVVEGHPKGLVFWRSFTHWIGGMGVLVLTLAILPSAGAKTLHIMKAESPGPTPGKLVPKIGQTAKILYGIYLAMTVVLIVILMVAGLSPYDAMIHAFGAAGTGGFSNMNASVGAFNNAYVDVILSLAMLSFGVNFTLYYFIIKGNIKSILKDGELRFYIGVVTAAVFLVTINIYGTAFKSFWQSLRHAFFQVSAIITTTGYATTDFNLWPTFSKLILVTLMFIGGCAGSTGGGLKNIRVLLLIKVLKRELYKIIHPRSIYSVRISGRKVEEETLSGVMTFFFAYMLVLTISVLVVSLDGFDFETSITSVAATLGNIGPGLGLVGPMGNYSEMSDISKITLSFCMLLGRLEIYPILLLAVPSFWKRVNI